MAGKQGEEGDEGGIDIESALTEIAGDLFQSDDSEVDDGESADRGTPADRDNADKLAGSGTAAPTKPAEGGETPGGEGAGTPAVDAAAKAAPANGQAGDAGATGSPDQPPQSWTQEAKDHWAQIPPRIRQEILKREGDFFNGLEQYKGEATIGRALRETVSPYLAVMRQHSVEPMTRIQELLQLNYNLSVGSPQQKAEGISRICKMFGVDPANLIVEQAYDDPAVAGLKKELETVRSGIDQMRQVEEARIRDANMSAVNAFIANPANVYVQEVVQDMVRLLNAKACKTLEEAYEKAVWANPITRAKEQSRLATEAEAKRAKEEADRVAAAKAATAANVKTSGRQGRQPEQVGSMDDTIAGTLASIRKRG